MGKKKKERIRKGKRVKKPKKKIHKGSLYEISGEGVKRMRRACPKCGAGVFMGDHKDRYVCGHCGYTEAKK